MLHRFFFAFLLPWTVVEEIECLRIERGIAGRLVAKGRLHVSILWLGDYDVFPGPLVERAAKAAQACPLPCCRLVFDELVIRPDRSLLVPSEPLQGAARFFDALFAAVRRAGLPTPARHRFSPHVTLAYGPGAAGPIDPFSWTANELALVYSQVGATRHEIIGRWPLWADGRRRSAA